MPVFFLKESLMLNCADIGQRPAAGENAINQVTTSLVELSHLSMLSTLCLALDAAVTTLDSARVVSPVQRPPDTQPPCLDLVFTVFAFLYHAFAAQDPDR